MTDAPTGGCRASEPDTYLVEHLTVIARTSASFARTSASFARTSASFARTSGQQRGPAANVCRCARRPPKCDRDWRHSPKPVRVRQRAALGIGMPFRAGPSFRRLRDQDLAGWAEAPADAPRNAATAAAGSGTVTVTMRWSRSESRTVGPPRTVQLVRFGVHQNP